MRALTAGIALIAVVATGCGDSSGESGDPENDPGAPVGDATAVLVRVGPAFEGFGLESGDPIADAQITVMGGDATSVALFEGVTDQDGRLVLPVESSQYFIRAEAETTDPMCWWHGERRDVELSENTALLITIDAGLVCS
jgi:hypothetical protein